MSKKTNWSQIRDQKYTETAQGRDVYNEQQMQRGHLQKHQTMAGRYIIMLIVSAMVAAMVYLGFAVVARFKDKMDEVQRTNAATESKSVTIEEPESQVSESDDLSLVHPDTDFEEEETVESDENSASTPDSVALIADGYTTQKNDDNTVIEVYKADGTLYAIESWELGQIKNSKIYDPDGNVIEEKTYSGGELNFAQYYNPDGTHSKLERYSGNYVDKVSYYEDDKIVNINYYNEDEILLSQDIIAEGSYITTSEYYKADGTVYRRDFYDGNTNNIDYTEYYDDLGTVVGTKKHHGFLYPVSMLQIIASLLAGILTFLIMLPIMKKNLAAQNMLADTDDINQYTNDQHVALPEEVQLKYDWFPDAGAHSSVQPNSMISHAFLQNKGVDKIQIAKRFKKDIVDKNGEIVYYCGEIIRDENGEAITEEVPMFDTDFGEALYDASDADKEYRFYYDTRTIAYNPNNENRDKLKGEKDSPKLTDKMISKLFHKDIKQVSAFDTVADLINNDWVIPEYEPQRPAGAYIVDCSPVNTMVLAMTRAGKGQTVIEPTIDMWTREKRQNNIVINDPKGELVVKYYVRSTVRGYQPIQFNLINPMKTDIYNPLGMAAQAAREGDFTKAAMYVENIADIFFPVDGSQDPVWPQSANNCFKRSAYQLIDYYLEEERNYRNQCHQEIARGKYIDPQLIESNIDKMWGKVTLYNCYQMFTQFASKKIENPAKQFATRMKNKEFDDMPKKELAALAEEVNRRCALWDGAPELDMLSLYSNATDKLPLNSMRRLVQDTNNALKSMGGAEKMLASVYGIAMNAMSFFTDPTISTLTSGAPSQTADLAGFSFPRRIGVRFHPDFLKRNHYVGLQCVWDAFEDRNFLQPLGTLFHHTDILSREGWARYFFDGKFEKDVAYIRLQLKNSSTNVLVHTYYFEFHKGYHTSLDGRVYIKDPVLGTKIAKNGAISELINNKGKYVPGSTTFKRSHLVPIDDNNKQVTYDVNVDSTNAITQTYVRYSEKPKIAFLITPPHLKKYSKLLLILIKQLVDLNFDQSYMTKENGKPLYKTRYMLDELGNLQSDGHGIDGLQTMLSIGLGQDQIFTIILQTLQQLRDVYGENCDKIIQGNTSNIIYLKSTDDAMIEQLSKMSGKTHKSVKDQKTITRDMEKLFLQNEGKASYMMQTKEVPVIDYNDLAFIQDHNSIVFRAGDSPVWNRNETILPMSWRLFQDTIRVPGKDFSLQTLPTLSSAMDFDIKQNQPDLDKMFQKRIEQAIRAQEAMDSYKEIFQYSDNDINRIDKDVYAGDIMDMINNQMARELSNSKTGGEENDLMASFGFNPTENTEAVEEANKRMAKEEELQRKIYVYNTISRADLITRGGTATHNLDQEIVTAYKNIMDEMNKDAIHFSYIDGSLCSADGTVVYLQKLSHASALEVNQAIHDENKRVYAESDVTDDELAQFSSWEVTDAFYQYLASLNSWSGIARGRFEEEIYRLLSSEEYMEDVV